MNRIAKLFCFVALLALTFVLALAGAPRAEAHPHCTLDEIVACSDHCGGLGCPSICTESNCICVCDILPPPNDQVN